MTGRPGRLALLAWMAAAPAAAQAPSLDRALQLERRGDYAAARDAYQTALAGTPAAVNALLGLERVLQALGRPEAMVEPIRAALAVEPTNPVLYGVGVRAWAAAHQPDSVRHLVDRWAQVEPGSEAPYREWGFAVLAQRDHAAARAAYRLGRERLGRADALAGELAQLATLEGEYAEAVREWVLAIRQAPGYRASAVGSLSQALPERRPAVLAQLIQRGDPVAAELAARLSARWGDPLRGLQVLVARLPAGEDGLAALQEFLDEVRTLRGTDAARARAQTLEAMAERAEGTGRADASRWLAEAARAYSEAGDQTAARRVLARLARDPRAAPMVASSAAATLIRVLLAEGRIEEAARRLDEVSDAVGVEERDHLRHDLAQAWLRAGSPDRAAALLEADSTVDGLALWGRVLLARGDLRAASDALLAAGPFAGERRDAADRAAILALLQTIDRDSLPALGRAFLLLEQGDSGAAAAAFEAAAQTLPAGQGGAELLVLAGRLRDAGGASADAARLFRLAGDGGGAAAAAAGRLELARILAREGARGEAVTVLERLILDYPESAVTPQARRLLDQVRDGTPRP